MKKWAVAIIGSGWRAGIFLRILNQFPGKYRVAGVVSRSAENRERISKAWNVPAYPDLEKLLSEDRPDFVVIAVAKSHGHEVIAETAALGLPILAETPPADGLDDLIKLNKALPPGYPIQIAEQYHQYPMNRARLSLAASGLLGTARYAHISISHGYHGISLIRRALGIGFENGEIRAHRTDLPITEGPGRGGPPREERVIGTDHTLAVLSFGEKKGLYDFETNQHRSWIRSSRFLIRGERGEINDDHVLYLKDHLNPVEFNLVRRQAGEYENVEGYYLKGILAGSDWIYRNPYPVSLSDEDIAIITLLDKMTVFIERGESFYSLAEASQDHYLGLMIDRAVREDRPVRTETQCWAP